MPSIQTSPVKLGRARRGRLLGWEVPGVSLVGGGWTMPISMSLPDLVDGSVVRRRRPAGEQMQGLLSSWGFEFLRARLTVLVGDATRVAHGVRNAGPIRGLDARGSLGPRTVCSFSRPPQAKEEPLDNTATVGADIVYGRSTNAQRRQWHSRSGALAV